MGEEKISTFDCYTGFKPLVPMTLTFDPRPSQNTYNVTVSSSLLEMQPWLRMMHYQKHQPFVSVIQSTDFTGFNKTDFQSCITLCISVQGLSQYFPNGHFSNNFSKYLKWLIPSTFILSGKVIIWLWRWRSCAVVVHGMTESGQVFLNAEVLSFNIVSRHI